MFRCLEREDEGSRDERLRSLKAKESLPVPFLFFFFFFSLHFWRTYFLWTAIFMAIKFSPFCTLFSSLFSLASSLVKAVTTMSRDQWVLVMFALV